MEVWREARGRAGPQQKWNLERARKVGGLWDSGELRVATGVQRAEWRTEGRKGKSRNWQARA